MLLLADLTALDALHLYGNELALNYQQVVGEPLALSYTLELRSPDCALPSADLALIAYMCMSYVVELQPLVEYLAFFVF